MNFKIKADSLHQEILVAIRVSHCEAGSGRHVIGIRSFPESLLTISPAMGGADDRNVSQVIDRAPSEPETMED